MRVIGRSLVVLLLSVALASCTGIDEPSDGGSSQSTSPTPSATPTLEARFERFIGKDASEAYFRMRELGYRVRFAPDITRPERLNVVGIRTHPEVVITEMVSRGTVVKILDVECYGRDGDVC